MSRSRSRSTRRKHWSWRAAGAVGKWYLPLQVRIRVREAVRKVARVARRQPPEVEEPGEHIGLAVLRTAVYIVEDE